MRVAAVSSRRAIPSFHGPTTAPTPTPGRYVGRVDGPLRQPVSFRFLGGGIRDLVIGDEMIARWIPVAAGAAVGDIPETQTEIRAMWSDDRRIDGWVRRPHGRVAGEIRFVARHRFRGLTP